VAQYKSVRNFRPISFDLAKLAFIVQHHFIATKRGIKPTSSRKSVVLSSGWVKSF